MTFDATRLTSLRRVSDVALSPDGTWLAVAVSRLKLDESSYVSDLWRVDLSDGSARQLTHSECSDHSPQFRRDGGLGFISARPIPGAATEDKHAQVWVLPAGGGESTVLTDEPHGVLGFRFSPAADVLVVLALETPGVDAADQRARASERKTRGGRARSTTRTTRCATGTTGWATKAPRFFVSDSDGEGRRELTPQAEHEFRDFEFGLGWDLSPSGDAIVTESRRLADDRLYDCGLEWIDTKTGERRPLANTPATWFTAPRFSRQGGSVVALAEPRPIGEWFRPQIVLFEPGAEPRSLASDFEGVPSAPHFTDDGRAIVFSAALAGQQPVFRVAIESGELDRLTAEAHGGSHHSLLAADGAVFGIRHTLTQPPEPFSVALEPGSEPRDVARLSGLEAGEIDFVSISTHSAEAADGSDVPWFLLSPQQSGGDASPAQLWIHGGPIGQWVDGWHWRWNPLVAVAAGYACALPNPRGSTGLGATFSNQIWNNRWGAECFTDLMSVTDDLAAREDIDEDRIAALGGSFGGYMANWIGTQTDRFRCLVSHAGIYHFPAFYGTTDHPPYWRLQMAGDPYSHREDFVTYSPHRFIDNWKSPVLVIHGELDYRVPISEALLLFDALRDRKVDAELLVFPNENHWILRPHNARRWYGEVMDFIDKHMAQ